MIQSLQIRISYRTPSGDYREAVCQPDYQEVCRSNDYVQSWMLVLLPEGSFVTGLKMGWVPYPSDEAILRRIHAAAMDRSGGLIL
jgi:hypothetical protein